MPQIYQGPVLDDPVERERRLTGFYGRGPGMGPGAGGNPGPAGPRGPQGGGIQGTPAQIDQQAQFLQQALAMDMISRGARPEGMPMHDFMRQMQMRYR